MCALLMEVAFLKFLASDDSLKARNILKLMLAHDADPTLSDAQGFSTIHNASSRDNLPLVKFLIETAKVPVNTPLSEFNEGYYQTPILIALSYGQSKVANYLFDQGGSLNKGQNTKSSFSAIFLGALDNELSSPLKLLYRGYCQLVEPILNL